MTVHDGVAFCVYVPGRGLKSSAWLDSTASQIKPVAYMKLAIAVLVEKTFANLNISISILALLLTKRSNFLRRDPESLFIAFWQKAGNIERSPANLFAWSLCFLPPVSLSLCFSRGGSSSLWLGLAPMLM